MSGMLLIIGLAGIAGAIERGSSLVPPVIITAIATTLILHQIRREELEEKNISNNGGSSASYPAGLERIRRRA